MACRGKNEKKITNDKKGKDAEFPCGRKKRRGETGSRVDGETERGRSRRRREEGQAWFGRGAVSERARERVVSERANERRIICY